MKRIIAWILVLASCFGMLSVTASATQLPFTDVASDAYYAAPVAWAVEKGITTGVAESTFAPDATCTRGQVVTFLHRAAGSPAPTKDTHNFTDINEGDYYYDAVLWAVEKGITAGVTETTFAPNATCTRGQVVTFLHRTAGSPEPAETTHNFTDIHESDYYYNAVLWAVEKGITKGVSDTAFDPNGTCTRGQVVTFLYRYFSVEETPETEKPQENRPAPGLTLVESPATVENGSMLHRDTYVVAAADGEETTVVYFPVTIYNYDDRINNATDALDTNTTTVREGLYFTNGSPASNMTTVADLSTFVEGDYYIQNIRAEANRTDGASWLQAYTTYNQAKIYAVPKNQATVWTLSIEDDEYYLSCTINNNVYYMVVGTNGDNDGYTTTKTPIELVGFGGDPRGVQIKQGDHYLCQWGSVTARDFGGYDQNNDGGNGMLFYPVDSDTPIAPVSSETKVTSGYEIWNRYDKNASAGHQTYTGLVQDTLINDQIVFNVSEGGIFNDDENVKDIYEYVGLPFVVDENGYYVFDSELHGVYFEGAPQSGTATEAHNLVINVNQPQPIPSGANVPAGFTHAFLPFNNASSFTVEQADYHFGMRADIPFSMTANGRVKATDDNSAPITFSFSGDDDVWVFIDGHLVIDLGGIHDRLEVTINFQANTITYESNSFNDSSFATTQKLFTDGEGEGVIPQTRDAFALKPDHEMQIFYLERGEGASNGRIRYNLPMSDTVLITKDATQSWSEEQDNLDGEDGDGTQALTAREQAAVNNIDFGFTLYKFDGAYLDNTGNPIAGSGLAPYPIANTKYILQDKDGNVIGNGVTDANGKFYLKNGQTAKFITDIPAEGVTYFVTEDQTPEGFLTPDYQYAGKAANGFNYQGMGLVPGTDTIQEFKGHVADAADMGEHELPMAEEGMVSLNQSYIITAMGSTQASDSLEFICINYLDENMPKPSAFANEDIIVLDYGLPVVIDPLANDVFRGEDVEIVAWGDETLTLNEVLNGSYAVPDGTEGGTSWTGNKTLAVAYAYDNSGYSTTPVDMADCLYTFRKNGEDTFEVSAITADGETVYLNQFSTTNNNIPNVTTTPGKIKVEPSNHKNMFKLTAQTIQGAGSGSARTLHFHSEASAPYWNRCGSDNSAKCAEYLYRPALAGETSSTEIPGYILVTDTDDIVDGGQYLIVHNDDNNNLYVLYPSTSSTREKHVAKVGTTAVPAIGTSFSFDSGNVTFNDVTYSENQAADGTMTSGSITRDTFTYTLNKQMTEVEVISYIIKATATETNSVTNETTTVCRYSLAKIYIVPATTMYYEENFANMITFKNGKGAWDENAVTNADAVDLYQEPGVMATVGDSTYGSDVAYLNDSGDSNGTSRHGDTTNGAIQFSYTFTGTGSSFFARTSATTGYLQVKLYAGNTATGAYKTIAYVDTYYEDDNGTDEDSDGTLYNIPVYTTEDLPYGTYTLVVTVAKKGTIGVGGENGSGNDFYLDGIRVIQPLNVHITKEEAGEPVYDDVTAKALSAYTADNEANVDIVTLRDKIITDSELDETNWNFVVFTDTNGEVTSAEDYESIGPKEEVYLKPGQSVSFSIKYWHQDGYLLHLGMKAPFGTAGVQVGQNTYELKNAPDCYYNITGMQTSIVSETDDKGNTYYVATYTITATDGIVSLTNLKVTGNYTFKLVENVDIHVEGYIAEDGE